MNVSNMKMDFIKNLSANLKLEVFYIRIIRIYIRYIRLNISYNST